MSQGGENEGTIISHCEHRRAGQRGKREQVAHLHGQSWAVRTGSKTCQGSSLT